MYGDTEVMRRRADALREQASDIRAAADRLVAQADAVAWSGRAADSMRDRIRERSSHLRDVAATHDAAADSLDTHVAEVDRLKETITEVERKVDGLLAEARDDTLAGFVRPAAGHRDWLTVTVPGL
jgi:uncharacterized coiled-coil DUF342 family protein